MTAHRAQQTRLWLRYNALFRPLARLPPRYAYPLASLIGRRDQYTRNDARQAITNGLRAAFPDCTPTQLHDWLRCHFVMLAQETHDAYYLRRFGRAGDDLSNAPLELAPGALGVLRQAQQRAGDCGVLLLVNHFGRVNLVLLALALHGIKLGMLTGTIDRRNAELDTVEARHLQRKVAALRRFVNGRWVSLADNLRPLYRGLANGETLAFALDVYSPTIRINRRSFPFLGGQLKLSSGVARLAAKTGARMVYGVALTEPGSWRARIELRPLPGDPSQAQQQAVRELEQDLLNAPWQWWQWGILPHLWTAET